MHERLAVPAAVSDGTVGSVRDKPGDGYAYVPLPIRARASDATVAPAATVASATLYVGVTPPACPTFSASSPASSPASS